MNICPMLFRDINLEPNSLQSCCDVYGCEVPRFKFHGGQVDMKAYVAHLADSFRRIQDKNDKLCKGCANLKTSPDNSKNVIAIKFRTISINSHRFLCNCKCVYCNLWKYPEKGVSYDILPVLKSLYNQHAIEENCFISWGGGEPSILKSFDETAKWVLEHGYYQNVHTNAIRYSPAISSLLQNKRGQINISLDSGTPETYERVKGVNAFQKVLNTLKRYIEESCNPQAVTLKYIIFEPNNSLDEIKKFLDLCSQLKIPSVNYSLDFREINKSVISSQTINAAAYFIVRAKMLGINTQPFFIPPKIRDEISALLPSE